MLWLDLFAKLLHIMRIPKYRNGIILYYPRLLFRLALIYLQSKSAAFHPEFGSNIIIDEEAVSQSFKQRHRPPPSLRRQKKWDNDDYVRRACEKSRAALDGLMKLKLSNADDDDQHHRHELSHLIEVTTVENLCLVDSGNLGTASRVEEDEFNFCIPCCSIIQPYHRTLRWFLYL